MNKYNSNEKGQTRSGQWTIAMGDRVQELVSDTIRRRGRKSSLPFDRGIGAPAIAGLGGRKNARDIPLVVSLTSPEQVTLTVGEGWDTHALIARKSRQLLGLAIVEEFHVVATHRAVALPALQPTLRHFFRG